MQYVGTCTLHPLYECLGDSAEEAMERIVALVDGLDLDSEVTDVDPPLALQDTQEVTNVCWPPFEPLPLVAE